MARAADDNDTLITLSMTTIDGQTILELADCRNMTIRALQRAAKTACGCNKVKLLKGSRILEPSWRIEKYGLQDGDALQVVVMDRDDAVHAASQLAFAFVKRSGHVITWGIYLHGGDSRFFANSHS